MTTTTSRLLEVFVPGQPAAQGSKRHVGGGRLLEQSKKVRPWRNQIVAVLATTGRHLAPLEGAVRADLEFVMPRPLATPKTRPTPPAVKRPDLDKLIRAVFDAISDARVWKDDSCAVQVMAGKRIAEPGEATGCRIRLEEVA